MHVLTQPNRPQISGMSLMPVTPKDMRNKCNKKTTMEKEEAGFTGEDQPTYDAPGATEDKG